MFGTYNIAVMLIAIMLSVSGIVLGLGYAIDDKRMKEFGRSELYQSIINGVIVGTLIAAFATGGIFAAVINSMVGSMGASAACEQSMSGNYAICFAYDYLVGIHPISISGVSYPSLLEESAGLLIPVSVLYAGLSMLGSIHLSIGIVSIGFSSMLKPALTALDYVIEALTASIIGIEVQSILLKFISVTAIPVLLPIGIVLRIFYFTRRLGGAIMAIAIGLFAVFPLTYVLNATLVSSYSSNINNGVITSFINTETSTASGIIGSATSISNNTKYAYGIVGSLESSINGIINGIEGFLNQLMNAIAFIIIEVFFLPIFSIILTAISIRELARVLGSEISFGRLYIF